MKTKTTALIDRRGSIEETRKQKGLSFAAAFLTVEAIIICDVSVSMSTNDVAGEGGPTSRHAEANRQLQRLQARFPGKLAVVAFSDNAEFRPDGTLPPVRSSTNLLGALQFVSAAAGCGIKFIVVSDGEPSDVEETLRYAKTLHTKIDAIHVGSSQSGKEFMQRLAAASGGKAIDESVLELGANITKLLQEKN